MKVKTAIRNTPKRLCIWALIVAALLTIPLFFHWPWTWHDFVFGALMLFGSATVYEVTTRNMQNARHRLIVGGLIFIVLATIWVILATG